VIDTIFLDIFRTISAGLLGVWAGRCWQRAIDAEKTMDALTQKYEGANKAIDAEFDEVEKLLLDYAEKLEQPTANDLNRILNEDNDDKLSPIESDALLWDSEPMRASSLSEGSAAEDSDSDHGEEADSVSSTADSRASSKDQ
tara:strand:- start:297 stop:722 length:426 start_codon:yes stop_codon:yes gene_type:complete